MCAVWQLVAEAVAESEQTIQAKLNGLAKAILEEQEGGVQQRTLTTLKSELVAMCSAFLLLAMLLPLALSHAYVLFLLLLQMGCRRPRRGSMIWRRAFQRPSTRTARVPRTLRPCLRYGRPRSTARHGHSRVPGPEIPRRIAS